MASAQALHLCYLFRPFAILCSFHLVGTWQSWLLMNAHQTIRTSHGYLEDGLPGLGSVVRSHLGHLGHFGRGTPLLRGLTITVGINHLLGFV